MNERILEALGELERERQQSSPQPLDPPLSGDFKARLAKNALREVGVVPIRPRRRPFAPLIATAAAAAAALFFFVVREPPLPSYELSLTGGERTERSGDTPSLAATPRLTTGSALNLELRPEEPVTGSVAARLYLWTGGKLVFWDAAVQVSSEGAVQLDALVGPALPQGDAELVIALARADELPELAAIEKGLLETAEPPGSWRLFRRRIEIAAPR